MEERENVHVRCWSPGDSAVAVASDRSNGSRSERFNWFL